MLWTSLSGLLVGTFAGAHFQEPLAVAEPDRLALTPSIDGKLEPNEWDAFASNGVAENYFQWEPGRLHAAGKVSAGQDLLVSVDLRNNGWLAGKDNYQIRASLSGGQVVLEAKKLDATDAANGPQWVDASVLLRTAKASAASVDGGHWIEFSVDDDGLGILPRDDKSKVGVRLDSVPAGQQYDPFLPRTMTATQFVFDRGSSIPGGLQWKPQFLTRSVAPGQVVKIRLTFNGANQLGLKRVDVDSRGMDGEAATKVSYPFPGFDKKGRAFLDYVSPIPASAEPGYRILRAVVTDEAGNSAFLRSSYRIAPMFELELRAPEMKASEKERTMRVGYYISSHASARANCTVEATVPAGWKADMGGAKSFVVYSSRASQRHVFELTIPAGAKGTFPITLTAKVGDKTYTTTDWAVLD